MTLSSLGSVFQSQYHFTPTTAGLSYLGLTFGGLLGLAATPRISDYFGRPRPHHDGFTMSPAFTSNDDDCGFSSLHRSFMIWLVVPG